MGGIQSGVKTTLELATPQHPLSVLTDHSSMHDRGSSTKTTTPASPSLSPQSNSHTRSHAGRAAQLQSSPLYASHLQLRPYPQLRPPQQAGPDAAAGLATLLPGPLPPMSAIPAAATHGQPGAPAPSGQVGGPAATFTRPCEVGAASCEAGEASSPCVVAVASWPCGAVGGASSPWAVAGSS